MVAHAQHVATHLYPALRNALHRRIVVSRAENEIKRHVHCLCIMPFCQFVHPRRQIERIRSSKRDENPAHLIRIFRRLRYKELVPQADVPLTRIHVSMRRRPFVNGVDNSIGQPCAFTQILERHQALNIPLHISHKTGIAIKAIVYEYIGTALLQPSEHLFVVLHL